MIDGAQKIAKAIGESGCYFLSLCKVADDYRVASVDAVAAASTAMASGLLDGECFVQDAGSLFSALVGSPWDCIKAGEGHPLTLDYKLQPGEREILRFERPNPSGGEPLAHFVAGDGAGRVAWDPWPNSLTVAQGRLVSRRILRRKA